MSKQRSVLTSLILIVVTARAASGATCDSLKSVSFPRTSISSAAVVAAGTFVPPPTPDTPPTDFHARRRCRKSAGSRAC